LQLYRCTIDHRVVRVFSKFVQSLNQLVTRSWIWTQNHTRKTLLWSELKPNTLHRCVFCQFPCRWIYYYHSSKFTGKETGKTHLCALGYQLYYSTVQVFLDFRGLDFRNFWFNAVYNSILFSSPLVLLSNLNLRGFPFHVVLIASILNIGLLGLVLVRL
jgi:hypothetical protein